MKKNSNLKKVSFYSGNFTPKTKSAGQKREKAERKENKYKKNYLYSWEY